MLGQARLQITGLPAGPPATRRGWPNRAVGLTRSFTAKGTCLSPVRSRGRRAAMKMAGLPKLTRGFHAISVNKIVQIKLPPKTASGFFTFYFFTKIEMLVPKFIWKRTGPTKVYRISRARSAGGTGSPGSARAPSSRDSSAGGARRMRGRGGPGAARAPA